MLVVFHVNCSTTGYLVAFQKQNQKFRISSNSVRDVSIHISDHLFKKFSFVQEKFQKASQNCATNISRDMWIGVTPRKRNGWVVVY